MELRRFPFMSVLHCAITCSILFTHEASGNEIARSGKNQLSNLKFTTDLYSRLNREKPDGEVFFSPFSISLALAMLNEGAKGNSSSQIRKALGLAKDYLAVRNSVKTILQSIESDKDNVTLNIAAKLYSAKNVGINEAFNETLANHYETSIEHLNFWDSETARKRINDWIESQTHQKIQDLLPPGSVKIGTMMVLANAVYFKGEWSQKFDRAATATGNFFASSKEIVEVDMMRVTADFPVMETDQAYVIDLPYTGKKVYMTLIVPKQRRGLSTIEKNLTETKLKDFLQGHRESKTVNLILPRFKIESSFKLRKLLSEVGITDIFSPLAADLSGISNTSLFCDEGYHKALIEVNEEGAEAAAATVITLIELSSFDTSLDITVDHPSLIAIQHVDLVEPLFFGRLRVPKTPAELINAPQKASDPASPSEIPESTETTPIENDTTTWTADLSDISTTTVNPGHENVTEKSNDADLKVKTQDSEKNHERSATEKADPALLLKLKKLVAGPNLDSNGKPQKSKPPVVPKRSNATHRK